MPEVSDAGARRPLTARSVIASTLLGVDPPRLPALALVRSGELFGLREGATRTALSRMAAAGEVVPDDGHYALAGPLLERHARQRSARRGSARGRSARGTDRAAGRDDWNGTWVLAVVTTERRDARARADFRSAARRLRLAEVREGVWARPDHGDRAGGAADREVVDDQAVWIRGARPDDIGPFLDAFDLDGWARRAENLIVEMTASQPALDERRVDVVADTFVLAAAVLRHLLADPAFPDPLLPDRWPGDRLRSTFDRFDEAFKATWRAWYGSFRAEEPEKTAKVSD